METIGRTTQLMTLSGRPRRNWRHRAAALPPSENRLREQRRFKGNVRVLLQLPRVHRFLDCFRDRLACVDSRPARLRSFLNHRYGRIPIVQPF